MKKVRLGLVGSGRRGVANTRSFKAHPDCEVTALMDRYIGVARKAAAQLELPDAQVYDDFAAMLRDAPVDALYIASDPLVQVDLACEAMNAGRHVCTEVPAAFTLQECRKLVDTVERTGVKYQLMEQMRYAGFVETWKRMVDRGELGHERLAQGEYVHYSRNWGYWTDLDTGEILNDLTRPAGRNVEPTWRYRLLGDPILYLPHTLSPLLKILDDRVVRVSCMGTQQRSYTYPDEELPWRDIEYALMHTAKDTVLLAGAGFSLPNVHRGKAGSHWYELRGTQGSVESPRSRADPFRVWRQGTDDYESMDLSTVPEGADERTRASGHGGMDFRPVHTFIRSILDDTTPAMDVVLAVETAAPAIVAAQSAREGGVLLEVPDYRLET